MKSRLPKGRWSAAAVLTLALTVSGCTSGGGGMEASDGPEATSSASSSAPSAEVTAAADDAATLYVKKLQRYQRQVARAAATMAAWKTGDPVARWNGANEAFLAARDLAPELEVVEGGAEGSTSYARMVEIAKHVQGFVDEHDWMAGWDVRENTRAHSDLYLISSDQYNELDDLRDDRDNSGAGKGGLVAGYKTALRHQLQILGTVRAKVEKLAGKDSFTPSLRDHLLHEIGILEEIGERYVEYVETTPASSIETNIFRNAFVSGVAFDGGAMASATEESRTDLRTLMAQKLSRLVKAAKAGDDEQGALPVVGDIYRDTILDLFVPHTEGEDEVDLATDKQLYWLWHLREIEDTPDEAFDNLRLTIMLQQQGPESLVDVNIDSRFDELAATYVAMWDIVKSPESMAANKPWLIEMLARPYPDVLAKAVELEREAAELMPDDDSETPAKLFTIGPKIQKALEDAADHLDSVPRYRRSLRKAVAATRPDAEG